MALWNDATYALRQLRKSTGFTLIVLATLALCIGMNTAIYSVLDAVLFRPAPFPEPDRLAMLVTAVRGKRGEEIDTSQTGALYEAVRDRAGLLDCAAWSGIGGGGVSSPAGDGEGGGDNYGVVARLRGGVSWPAANAQLAALSRNLRDDPAFPREADYFEERVMPLTAGLVDESRRELLVTWGAVLMVPLI